MRYRPTAGATLQNFGSGTPAIIRAAIVAALNEQPRSARELAEYLDRPPGTIAYHLRTLVLADLVEELPDQEEGLKDL